MKRSDAFPARQRTGGSSYLSARFVAAGPIRVTVDHVEMETFQRFGGEPEEKPVAHFLEPDVPPLPLNRTNWESLESLLGSDDSDRWSGRKIELYQRLIDFPEPDTPAVRIRAALPTLKRTTSTAATAPVSEDDIPF